MGVFSYVYVWCTKKKGLSCPQRNPLFTPLHNSNIILLLVSLNDFYCWPPAFRNAKECDFMERFQFSFIKCVETDWKSIICMLIIYCEQFYCCFFILPIYCSIPMLGPQGYGFWHVLSLLRVCFS